MILSIPEGLLLGLSTGPACFAYCAPVLLPFLISKEQGLKDSFRLLFSYLAGRFLGYLLVGMIVGIIGSSFANIISPGMTATLNIITGLFLLFFGVLRNFPSFKLCRMIKSNNSSTWAVIFAGLLTGLNLCPPFLAAIAQAAGTGSFFLSMIFFAFFFLGTSLFLIPIFFVGITSKVESFRMIAKVSLILSGLWFAGKGMLMVLFLVMNAMA